MPAFLFGFRMESQSFYCNICMEFRDRTKYYIQIEINWFKGLKTASSKQPMKIQIKSTHSSCFYNFWYQCKLNFLSEYLKENQKSTTFQITCMLHMGHRYNYLKKIISTGLELVLSHTEKSNIASYYRQFFKEYSTKNIFSARAIGP